MDCAALDGGDIHPLTGQLVGCDLAGDDVVGQDLCQLALVLRLEQRVERALGQGCEGRVGGREDGKGAVALERIHKPCGLNGRHEGRKLGVRRGDVDDILRRLGLGTGGQRTGCGGEYGGFEKAAALHVVMSP